MCALLSKNIRQMNRLREHSIEYYYYFCIVIDFKCALVCICMRACVRPCVCVTIRRWEKTINRSIAPGNSSHTHTRYILTLVRRYSRGGGEWRQAYTYAYICKAYTCVYIHIYTILYRPRRIFRRYWGFFFCSIAEKLIKV